MLIYMDSLLFNTCFTRPPSCNVPQVGVDSAVSMAAGVVIVVAVGVVLATRDSTVRQVGDRT